MTHKGWKHISTGDLFRAEINSGSDLGNSVKSVLASGQLVSDEVTNQVFESQVRKIVGKGGVEVLLLDGFPRTPVQARFLMGLGSEKSEFGPLVFVEFGIAEEMVIKRVADRLVNPRTGRVYHKVLNPPKMTGICDEDGGPLIQREDDKPETIKNRFGIYKEQLGGILGAVQGGAQLRRIDAEGKPAEVQSRLENEIRKALTIKE